MRVLFDTNVIVDVLQKRSPWYETGRKLFQAAAGGQITACVSAKQVNDLHYFSKKQFAGEEKADEKARQVIVRLLSFFEVIDTTGEDCRNALLIPNGDFEDAVLMAGARRERVNQIVTRNTEHFLQSPIPVVTPEECWRLIEESITEGERK